MCDECKDGHDLLFTDSLMFLIRDMSDFQTILIDYFDSSNGFPSNLEMFTLNLKQKIIEKQISNDKKKLRQFLFSISRLITYSPYQCLMMQRITPIIQLLKDSIKKLFSPNEIYKICTNYYCRNKLLILFLLEENLITVTTIIESIVLNLGSISHENFEWHLVNYFFPEIRNSNELIFNLLVERKYISNEFFEKYSNNLDDFYEKRRIGENSEPIIQLIRQNNLDDYITYIEKHGIDITSKVDASRSIFELNNVLLSNKLDHISLSAFFGAIQIFKFLFLRYVEIPPFIWCYAILGRNYEIIHILEEREISVKNKKYCLRNAINNYYNEIVTYFDNVLSMKIPKSLIGTMIKSQNFPMLFNYLKTNKNVLGNTDVINKIFRSCCLIGFYDMVILFLKQQDINFNNKNKVCKKINSF